MRGVAVTPALVNPGAGPAFGGATGILFYTCYVINCAFNTTAMVEDIFNTFMAESPKEYQMYMYHGVLFVLLCVGLAGAEVFAKVNSGLFSCLVVTIFISWGSMLFAKQHNITTITPDQSGACHSLDPRFGVNESVPINYYKPSSHRFHDNWGSDYSEENKLETVVALVFTTCCGIMVGANLSGDLANPGDSLPKGTLSAMGTSFCTYVVTASLLSLTFDRDALQCEYLVLQKSAVSPYIVVVGGIAMATLSTSLGAMLVSARILQAIARDDIVPISYFAKGTAKGDEPRRAVVITWALANVFGYIGGGSVKGIAAILTDFFLTACASVNLSQMLLSLSNAPNYRPAWKYTTWWSSALGFVLALSLMWYLNPVYAAITCGLWAIIFTYIKQTCEEKPWGDVTQAIRFRTVVDQLRELVQRKDCAKFWRSSILLLAEDTDYPLLSFCKHLSSDGLFIVGTGVQDEMMEREDDPPGAYEKPFSPPRRRLTQTMLPNHSGQVAVIKATWLWFIEYAQLNAFVTVGVGKEMLHIYRNMVSCAGLGGLVPNTVMVPFRDSDAFARAPPDYVARINEQLAQKSQAYGKSHYAKMRLNKPSGCSICNHDASHNSEIRLRNDTEYVQLLKCVLDLQKNLMVVRNTRALAPLFHGIYERSKLMPTTIDLWIIGDWDITKIEQGMSLLLQNAHLMQASMGKATTLRIVQVVQYYLPEDEYKFHTAITKLAAHVRIPVPEMLVLPMSSKPVEPPATRQEAPPAFDHFKKLNELIVANSGSSELVFLTMPQVPASITDEASAVFMRCLKLLTDGLPPVALISKGEMVSVISTEI